MLRIVQGCLVRNSGGGALRRIANRLPVLLVVCPIKLMMASILTSGCPLRLLLLPPPSAVTKILFAAGKSFLPKSLHQRRIDSTANSAVSWSISTYTRIAKRAGIGTIPRPFDNMRASRSTEIHREHGAKKESVWIGTPSKWLWKVI